MIRIAAVVVTYNRIKYLKKCISALQEQVRPLDAIYIINNGSTDGTKEWLDQQSDLMVVHQENVGGSGGFYRGIQEAYQHGFDWVWTMDDDVNPASTCLAELCKYIYLDQTGILCPQRIKNGNIQLDEVLKFNLSNPFKALKRNLQIKDIIDNAPIDIEGMAFEGPLISKKTIQEIGFPNKDLFIFWDDTDYAYRAILANLKVKYIPGAVLNKEDLSTASTDAPVLRSWKTPYGLRNLIYFTHTYGKNKFFRIVYPRLVLLKYFIGFLLHRMKQDGYYKRDDFQVIIKVFHDGMNNRLGKI